MGSEVATQLASYEDPSASDRKVWKVAGYVVLALTAILILVTLVMVRRIKVSSLLRRAYASSAEPVPPPQSLCLLHRVALAACGRAAC